MRAGRRLHLAVCALSVAASITTAGCLVGPSSNARVEQTLEVISEARTAGAYGCAPRELAMAEAHLDFARAELVTGDTRRGEAHLVEAELNAGAALRLSHSTGCPIGVKVGPAERPINELP